MRAGPRSSPESPAGGVPRARGSRVRDTPPSRNQAVRSHEAEPVAGPPGPPTTGTSPARPKRQLLPVVLLGELQVQPFQSSGPAHPIPLAARSTQRRREPADARTVAAAEAAPRTRRPPEPTQSPRPDLGSPRPDARTVASAQQDPRAPPEGPGRPRRRAATGRPRACETWRAHEPRRPRPGTSRMAEEDPGAPCRARSSLVLLPVASPMRP
nr:uncharacterized protein LOC113807257 [Penaeus vannamei]